MTKSAFSRSFSGYVKFDGTGKRACVKFDTSAGVVGLLVLILASFAIADEHGGGVAVDPSTPIPASITTHTETIPLLGHDAKNRAVKSGMFGDPTVWSEGRVPDGDDFAIVGYQLHSCNNCGPINARYGHVYGEGSSLTITGPCSIVTLYEAAGATVRVKGHPVITIKDSPIDLTADPLQHGNGIVCIDSAFHVEGDQPRQAYCAVAAEIHAGDTSIELAAIPEGWQAGDELLLPDTRQPTSEADFVPEKLHTERVRIDNISGKIVNLTAPVAHDHLGWHRQDGTVGELFRVGCLTQPVVIRSENPAGTRGHILCTQHADVRVSGLQLTEMGRTSTAPLGAGNQIGRYPFHLHHVCGMENSQAIAGETWQWSVEHLAVDGSPKWGVAIHGSHWGLLDNFCIHNAAGCAVVIEDPNCYANVVRRGMLVAHQRGSGLRITNDHNGRSHRQDPKGDFWTNRGGIGLTGLMNEFSDVDTYCCTESIGIAGHKGGSSWYPARRGVHVTGPKHPDAINISYQPYRANLFFPCERIRCWSGWRGLETWTADCFPTDVQPDAVWLGRADTKYVKVANPYPDMRLFPGLKTIHTRIATDLQDQRKTHSEDWALLGDFSQCQVPLSGRNHSVGLQFKPHYEFGHTHRNLQVRGLDVGYATVGGEGAATFDGGAFESAVAVYGYAHIFARSGPMTMRWNGTEFPEVNGKRLFVKEFADPVQTFWPIPTTTVDDRSYVMHLMRMELRPWADGRDINVYHRWQHPDAVFQPTPPPIGKKYRGIPIPANTQQQLLDTALSINGEPMPEWSEQAEEFAGWWIATLEPESLKNLYRDVRLLRERVEALEGN